MYPDYMSAYPAQAFIERRDLDFQTCFTGDPAAAGTPNYRGVVPGVGCTGWYILTAHLGGEVKRVVGRGGVERRDLDFQT